MVESARLTSSSSRPEPDHVARPRGTIAAAGGRGGSTGPGAALRYLHPLVHRVPIPPLASGRFTQAGALLVRGDCDSGEIYRAASPNPAPPQNARTHGLPY